MPRHRGRIVNLFLKKSLSCIRYRLATGLPLAWQLAMATYISAPILCVREPGNHHFPFRRRRPWPVQRDLYSQTRRCWWCWSSGAWTPGQASARHALFPSVLQASLWPFGREGATRAGSTKTTRSPFGVRSLVPAARRLNYDNTPLGTCCHFNFSSIGMDVRVAGHMGDACNFC